ncbi:tetratricopeptide repeat protein [Ruficoccus sp. ZRK36]|uniref:tetratricopeptide repeat protein n=1 Tax=Ruficoccus sp. ZRK36 TaxID=2866311 RepID=UPI001C731FAF|nr:tetratricopeptide repeat protein [Ruficoccus sp. ZRK36]QYY36679.1 tetratricopeptide repeat protein [Ruficoccus sp. ZRK36]
MLRSRTVLLCALCLLLAIIPAGLQAELIAREQGLQATLQEAVTAFEEADYARAAEGFAYLEKNYASEPAYQKIEQQLLPVWAHACRINGDHARAAELYETFLERYPEDDTQAAYVLFGLAQACQALGENARASEAYRAYRERFPERPEALISVLREAELDFSQGEIEAGITSLLAFAADPRVPPTLRAQARLRAVQAAQANGEDTRASEILLSEPWAVTTMPELAMLAFASLRAGDALAREGKYTEAILAYRNVPPYQQLIELQRERLAQLERIRTERTRRNPEGIQTAAFWEEYFSGIIDKVEAELDDLVSMDNYTPAWQLKLGDAFLRAGRSREAGLLFGAVATDEALPQALREQAHYRWILCAMAREDWNLALIRAHRFIGAHPVGPRLTTIYYLIVETQLRQGKYTEAIDDLYWLIDTYPDDPRQPRWRFRLGYALALNQDYVAARDTFSALIDNFPDDELVLRARLWIGLSYFFEYNYPDALAAFDALTPDTLGTELEGETAYRRAATLYSMRDYAGAKEALKNHLLKYPSSPYTAQARVLLGDTLMGLGELDSAADQFTQVGPEAGTLYPYAVFQTGKIYRVLENYDKLIAHFEAYANDTPDSPRPRLAEALYWVGWAHAQQGDPAAGFPQFMDALARTGNDTQAGDTSLLLQALESLYTRARQDDLKLEENNTASAGLLRAESYTHWLEAQRENALKRGELTRASRYALYLARIYRRDKRDDRADAVLYETMGQVPLERLDADGLSALGSLLAKERLPSATEYFTYQLEHFPRSPRSGSAFYGMAKLTADQGDNEQAIKWLKRFEAETPYDNNAPQAALLHADILISDNETNAAENVLKKSLQSPLMRGRDKAEALLMIAACAEARGNLEEAIACDQRVYTVYRAWPGLIARAYWHSANIFYQLGDLKASRRTLEEMMLDPRLEDTPEHSPAQALLDDLRTKLAPNTTDSSSAVEVTP